MTLEKMDFVITLFGIIFTITFAILLISGKKIRGDVQKQRIKISDKVDISLTSTILLIAIGAAITLTPVLFHYWRLDPHDYVLKKDIASPIIAVYGTVIFDNNKSADNLPIKIVRRYTDSIHNKTITTTIWDTTGSQGDFFIKLFNARLGEKFKLIWEKNGYIPRQLEFGLNEFPQTVIMKKEEGSN